MASCLTNVANVKAAVCRLKPHKNEGCAGLSSDHFINAGDDLCGHTALLFNAILVHGTLPVRFLYSTIIVPIHKGRNVNISDSANYRGIALSSIYGKLFDNIMLYRFRESLSTSELQFGFKPKNSILITVPLF